MSRCEDTGLPPMEDVSAGTYSHFIVVAAKVPNCCIVRCQALSFPPHDWCTMQRMVLQVVGSLNPEVEWTYHNYGNVPYYVGGRSNPHLLDNVGVFRYDHVRGGVYKRRGVLLDVLWPSGWLPPGGWTWQREAGEGTPQDAQQAP